MKRGIQVVILFFVLSGLSGCKKTEHDIFYNKKYLEEIKASHKDVSFHMANHFVPGATVAVVKDGELIYSEGLGLASKDLDVRTKRNTKFRIGTLSELFTNIIYQKMVEEGILHPDSSIQHYYPEFPKKQHKVLLKNLAQQTSGIRAPKYSETKNIGFSNSIEKGVKPVLDDPLVLTPGISQDISSYNYSILGLIMEKATDKKFPKILAEYITDTLHLENTVIDNPLISIKNRSDFFDRNYIAQVTNAREIDLRPSAPSNGLLSNAEDLAKFCMAILNSNYLSEETKKALFTPVPLANGAPSGMTNGWILMVDKQGNNVYGKSGEANGGGGSILYIPKENLIITYACNLTSSQDDTPVFKIAANFISQEEKKIKEDTKTEKSDK